ncbi:MAG: hypothetical protein II437_03285 [Oscillospiraceae bacterium]|jgi:hypothetical protein|nr:hypothetical protein [Oscillospiraceae bacterium]
MKAFLNKALLLIIIVSGVVVMATATLGILAEIFGPPIIEKLLIQLGIPLNYDRFLLVAYISTAVLFVTYFVREKLFGA